MIPLLLASWSACALRGVPHYSPVDFELPPPAPATLDSLPGALSSSIGSRRIRSWSAEDAGGELLSDLSALPIEAQYAVWTTATAANRGAELDLWVDTGSGPRPITLWWGTDRSVRVAIGPEGGPVPIEIDFDLERPEDSVALVPTIDDLAERLGFSGFSGDWTEEQMAVILAAMAELSGAEREAMAGVTMVRGGDSPRQPHRELAYFDPATEPPSLWFFDLTFARSDGFVGAVDAPFPPAAMTALHEIGHLVADAPLRRAYTAYVSAHDAALADDTPARRQEADARYRTYRRLGRDGPVIEAWEAFRRGRRGPSTFGHRDPHESFAEAFALFHLDPDALERALPGAVPWFVSSRHVRAAGLGGD